MDNNNANFITKPNSINEKFKKLINLNVVYLLNILHYKFVKYYYYVATLCA